MTFLGVTYGREFISLEDVEELVRLEILIFTLRYSVNEGRKLNLNVTRYRWLKEVSQMKIRIVNAKLVLFKMALQFIEHSQNYFGILRRTPESPKFSGSEDCVWLDSLV